MSSRSDEQELYAWMKEAGIFTLATREFAKRFIEIAVKRSKESRRDDNE